MKGFWQAGPVKRCQPSKTTSKASFYFLLWSGCSDLSTEFMCRVTWTAIHLRAGASSPPQPMRLPQINAYTQFW